MSGILRVRKPARWSPPKKNAGIVYRSLKVVAISPSEANARGIGTKLKGRSMNDNAQRQQQGPKYTIDIEGTSYPWDKDTITTEEIASLGGWDLTEAGLTPARHTAVWAARELTRIGEGIWIAPENSRQLHR